MVPERIKILAIDDMQDNLTCLKALINEAFPDAVMLMALNGAEGFELAVAESPDVILLDIVMPDMDGYELCRKLKNDEELRDIPVVFVTALKGDKDSRIRALESGAEAFLAKPIDEIELTAQIRAMVKIRIANLDKQDERTRLSALVAEQTYEIKRAHTATLNLLENLKNENEARKKSELARQLAENERTAMQSQLVQQDKMASMGMLAAGVAHEINNPIGFVGSNMATLSRYIGKYNCYIEHLELEICGLSTGGLSEQIMELRRSLKLDRIMNDIVQLVEESAEGIERVKQIVMDLKAFSHSDTTVMTAADLNSCLDSTINIVINEIKYTATLRREYGNLPKVDCNAQQINQVFMNLLINAAHAIQAKGVEFGEIVIRTWFDQGIVFVSISDTGCGMSTEIMDKVFEAFYTTKEVGKGTGLGLSISSSIINRHGGELLVTSVVGKGSTFTIKLPMKPPTSGEVS